MSATFWNMRRRLAAAKAAEEVVEEQPEAVEEQPEKTKRKRAKKDGE